MSLNKKVVLTAVFEARFVFTTAHCLSRKSLSENRGTNQLATGTEFSISMVLPKFLKKNERFSTTSGKVRKY